MVYGEEYERNLRAYRALRGTLDQSYPQGRHVAIYEGQILADAATPEEMIRILREQGKDPRGSLVVKAGDDTPEYADILMQGPGR